MAKRSAVVPHRLRTTCWKPPSSKVPEGTSSGPLLLTAVDNSHNRLWADLPTRFLESGARSWLHTSASKMSSGTVMLPSASSRARSAKMASAAASVVALGLAPASKGWPPPSLAIQAISSCLDRTADARLLPRGLLTAASRIFTTGLVSMAMLRRAASNTASLSSSVQSKLLFSLTSPSDTSSVGAKPGRTPAVGRCGVGLPAPSASIAAALCGAARRSPTAQSLTSSHHNAFTATGSGTAALASPCESSLATAATKSASSKGFEPSSSSNRSFKSSLP
mmetsp:Transcript_27217/g.63392  ORF Transcript_27217/g.63392 Transcript_27217/m.63392 type:complete len:279 (+) Transcript_27217:1960-2796(+)